MASPNRKALHIGFVLAACLTVHVSQAALTSRYVAVEPARARGGMLKPDLGPDLAAGPAATGSHRPGSSFVTLSGTVKNIGSRDFSSSPAQASARLVVHVPGESGPAAYRIVGQRGITTLRRGRALGVSGRFRIPGFIEMGHRTARFGECPAMLTGRVEVAYDPDIHLDGNPRNDDSNHRNDARSFTVRYMAECPW